VRRCCAAPSRAASCCRRFDVGCLRIPARFDVGACARTGKDGIIETKPHGHGDVHTLLHQHGCVNAWAAAGLRPLPSGVLHGNVGGAGLMTEGLMTETECCSRRTDDRDRRTECCSRRTDDRDRRTDDRVLLKKD
jgi:hypothetical protein